MTVKVAVCFAANDSFIQHATTAMYSFVKNNQSPWYDLFLLTNGLAEDSTIKLEKSIRNLNCGVKMKILKVDSGILSKFKGHVERLTILAYYRFLIPELLPNYNYAMYLDSDTICIKEIVFPFNQLKDNELLACMDYHHAVLAKERGLKRYLNSGVLFMNIDMFKRHNTFNELLGQKPPIMLYADQEILNGYFHNSWIELPNSYNFPAPALRLKNWFQLHSEIFIVHYVGSHKPWEYFRLASLYYWYYLIQTEYRIKIYTVLKTPWNSFKYLLSKVFIRK